MASAPIRFRSLTGGQLAFSVWLLADGSSHLQREDPDTYEKQSWAAPEPDAVFLGAKIGDNELDTVDGLPHVGDVWEVPVTLPGGKPGSKVVVCLSEGQDYYFYSYALGSKMSANGAIVPDVDKRRGGSSKATGHHLVLARDDFQAWEEKSLTLKSACPGVKITDGQLVTDEAHPAAAKVVAEKVDTLTEAKS